VRMSELRRMLGGIVALAVTSTLLAGLGAETASAGPGYQKPDQGDCRNLSYAQFRARSNSTQPVNCAATHTTQTVYVGKLPKRLSWKSSRLRINDAIDSRCQRAWNDAVGRSAKLRARSAFALATFEPTKAQKSQGARWFRCDAGLLRSTSLSPLTTTASPLLKKPVPLTQARCLTTSERVTTCDAAHQFKATHAFKLKAQRYPGKAKVKRLAKKGCRARVSTTSFRFEWPNRGEWADGNRFVVCFSAHTATANDSIKPVTTISAPTSVNSTNPVNITGTSTDNLAVSSLTFTVRNSTGQYLQDNGTLSGTANAYPFEVTAGGLGTKSVSWALQVPAGMPADNYTARVSVSDPGGNVTGGSDTFAVVGDDRTAPVVTISSPASTLTPTESFNILGSAQDPSTIVQVLIQIRRSNGQYLLDNGTWGSTNSHLDAAGVSGIGTGNVTFSYDADELPEDTYTVRVRARDGVSPYNEAVQTKTVVVDSTPVSLNVTYQMNEASGATTMIDSGGNGLDGVIDQSGLDTGVVFDGATGYQWPFRSPTALPPSPERVVQVPDDSLLDPGASDQTFTVEIRYRTNYSFGNIIQKGQSATTGGQWKIQAPGGYPSCLFKSSAGTTQQASVQSTIDLSDNQWHILRCTRDANYVRMWVDGVYINRKDASNVGTIDNNVPLTIAGKLSCGMDPTIECDYFTGHIDYVKLSRS